MNYELAKELKEAGFPQYGSGHGVFPSEEVISATFVGMGTNSAVYAPTLEELIEACAPNDAYAAYNKFQLIRGNYYEDNKWKAQTSRDRTAVGKTPTEAVACLWLALNNPL